jgi:signal transduction histidine kinase/DNA-binding response OmpR family regulator
VINYPEISNEKSLELLLQQWKEQYQVEKEARVKAEKNVALSDSKVKALRERVKNLEVQNFNFQEKKANSDQPIDIEKSQKQFLVDVGHDVRNPINALIGFIHLLYDTYPTEGQHQLIDNLLHSAETIRGLVCGVLDLEKYEDPNIALSERKLSLGDFLRAQSELGRLKSEGRLLLFELSEDPLLDFDVKADVTVLNLIFMSLYNNALKFTKRGKISTEVNLLDSDDHSAVVQIIISDTGEGIPTDKLQSIFLPYHHANLQTKLKYGSSGLGLTIVKRLVDLYEGTIEAYNNQDGGASFAITMLLEKSLNSSLDPDKKDQIKPGKMRILVVEDNLINQQYVTGILHSWNLTYDVAVHGAKAIEMAAKQEYNLILMDIRMPIMDGYEATIRLRSDSTNPNQRTPIIALTASSVIDEKGKAIAVGMDDHLTKPFTPDQLLSAIRNFDFASDLHLAESGSYDFSNELDIAFLDDFYQGDTDRAEMMFSIFLKVMDKEVAILLELMKDQNWKAFGAQAHKIKPNFAMVGLTELSTLMKEYESILSNDDLIKKIDSEFNIFTKKFDKGRIIVENEVEKIALFRQT